MIPDKYKFLFEDYDDTIYEPEDAIDDMVSEASIKQPSHPSAGEVWFYDYEYYNYKKYGKTTGGGEPRRCVIVDDPELGLVAIRCSKTRGKAPEKYHNRYADILSDWKNEGFSEETYFAVNNCRKLELSKLGKYKGKLKSSDYNNCLQRYKRFKKDKLKSVFVLFEYLKEINIKSTNSCTKLKRHLDLCKTAEGTTLDICTITRFVLKKYNYTHFIVDATLYTKQNTNLDLFFTVFEYDEKMRSFSFIPGFNRNSCNGRIEKYDDDIGSRDYVAKKEAKFIFNFLKHTYKLSHFTVQMLDERMMKVWDTFVSKSASQTDLVNTLKIDYYPLYFYHLAPEDADISKGLLSPYAAYKIGDKELISSMLNKYRNRAVNQWKFYPDRDPESLTVEELIDSLNKVRGKDGDKCIYFFKYPPYAGLGKNMKKSLEKYHVPYRININDPELKKHIIRIDWGWPQSDFTKPPLTKDYYLNVSKEEYFSKYTDNPKPGQPLFAPMSHISIAFKNGICPAKFLEKVDPSKKSSINESFREMITANTGEEIYYESLLHRATESVSPFSKDSNLFLSEDDIYCNFWDFENNRTHYCFVIGFSGSGKTNLARNLAKKYKAEWVSLDVLLYDSRVHSMTERFVSGMQKQKLLAKYLKETNIDLSYMKDVTYKETPEARRIMVETGKKFVDWLIHKNKQPVIIEGLDLIDIIPTDPSLYSAPIVFKGTSRLLSMFRRLQRSKFKVPLDVVMRMFSWYKTDAHGIDYLRSIVIGDYNYQYRPEPGAYDPGHQYRNTYN